MNGRRITGLFFVAILTGAVALLGCSGPSVYQMQSGERTAGADGELNITQDDNGNQLVQMSVAHLPHPAQLSEEMSTYVVWIQPDETSQRYNVGRLRLNDDRTGMLNFTTPFDRFDLMVTAEADPAEMSPSDQVVLRRAMGTE